LNVAGHIFAESSGLGGNVRLLTATVIVAGSNAGPDNARRIREPEMVISVHHVGFGTVEEVE
jgi:hypothetical protein